MKSPGNKSVMKLAPRHVIVQHKDAVYRHIVRASQGRKNADVDLLRALLEAHADLQRLDKVEGCRSGC